MKCLFQGVMYYTSSSSKIEALNIRTNAPSHTRVSGINAARRILVMKELLDE